MKTIATLLSLSLYGLINSLAQAQSPPATGLPIRVSLLNETVTLPSATRLVARFNPGLSVGTEWYYGQGPRRRTGQTEGRRHQWLQTLNVGGIYHRGLATSLLVTSEVGYRFRTRRVNVDLKAGPGYILNRSAAPIYQDTGTEYVKTAGIEHRLVVTTGLSVGVRTGCITPFLAYNVMVQTPFLQFNSPFLPQQLLQVGIATRIGQHKQP